jgi:serine-type D-Ala-D-Ala carboxypeptidase (penicillin-binding protein 5/6)
MTRTIGIAGLLIVAAWAAAVVLADRIDNDSTDHGAAATAVAPAVTPDRGTARAARNPYAVHPAPQPTPVRIAFKRPPKAGLLFDVHSGRVLWQLNPRRKLPIASLTKMLTALIVAQRHRLAERVLITPRVMRYSGSGVGVLPPGKRVKLGALLYGLLLVSGNDAAIALAQHDAHTVRGFVRRMNLRAAQLGLTCSHFTTPSGIQDKGNYSCPIDLATLARADLGNRVVRRIVATRHMRLRFPVKGHFLDLYNINPFLEEGMPGITGIKTGLTNRAGRCYVTTQRRGRRELGVVLLNSPDPLTQVPQLLQAGFRSGLGGRQ